MYNAGNAFVFSYQLCGIWFIREQNYSSVRQTTLENYSFAFESLSKTTQESRLASAFLH